MKKTKVMSQTELEIMELLWSGEGAMTPTGFLDYFEEKGLHSWKRQTISTFLARMGEKGLVTSEKKGREVFYRPVVTRKEYESHRATGMLDSLFEGSLKNFMAALFVEKSLSGEEIEDLKLWLDGQKEEGSHDENG